LEQAGHPSRVAAGSPVAAVRSRHVVDVLIEERAEHLRHRPLAWFLVKQFLYPVLRYQAAIDMANAIAALPGREVLDRVTDGLALKVTVEGLEHLPRTGRCVIVANHPTGIADGLALHQVVRTVRTDACFVANRDALRVAPGLSDVVIPVEWVVEKRTLAKTREMWRLAREAFKAERALVMFPSGRVAQLHGTKLIDRPWQSATILFATRNDAPVVPLHVSARNSWIYYFFARTNTELRDMTLFNELLNKKGTEFRLKFAPPIPPTAFSQDPEIEIQRLRKFVEEDLPQGLPWHS
jgi:putative hemolysin